jgi:hypothetical protein
MTTNHRRPRAEHCKRLTIGLLRTRVAPGATTYVLRDGQRLELRWSLCRGCFGEGDGRALLIVCPVCSRNCRVLWHPPGRGWGCCSCRPVSHRSHRRSGSSTGGLKPPLWRMDQLNTSQVRAARLLGLQEWPPNRLLWSWRDLEAAPLRPDAPRLSHRRRHALLIRLDCLEALRVALIASDIRSEQQALSADLSAWPDVARLAQSAVLVERHTRWAVRHGGHDARTLRERSLRKRAITEASLPNPLPRRSDITKNPAPGLG